MDLERLKPHFPWITLLVLAGLVGVANPSFFSPAGLILLAADIVPLFIMAIGMTFAIYIGGIDLSVQQLANMVTVMATVYLAQFGVGVALIVIIAGGVFRGSFGLCDDAALRAVVCLDLGTWALWRCRWPSGCRGSGRFIWMRRCGIRALAGCSAIRRAFRMS